MTPQEAVIIRNFLFPRIEEEIKTTRKVLAAVPEQQKEYRPDPKSRTAMELGWHAVGSEVWFLDGILKGQFPSEETKMPSQIKTVADLIAWYDQNVPGLLQKVKTMAAEDLARPVNFFGLFNDAAVSYLTFLLIHSVHHRGQLAAYLRPMGAKVPSIYGGSADEPFQMAAER